MVPKEQLPDVVYRVHQKAHEPEWFGTAGGMRWDPPTPAAADLFGVCYTATDPVTAFVETVADLPWLRRNVVNGRVLATLQTVGEQRLADLTNPRVVAEWGLDRRVCTGDDYEVCGKWAHAFRLAGFTGIFYEARPDLRVGPFRSVAVFGDPGHQPAQITLVDEGPLPGWVQESALADFGIQVASGHLNPARRPALVEPGQDASPVREQTVYRRPKSLSPIAATSPSKEAQPSSRPLPDVGWGKGGAFRVTGLTREVDRVYSQPTNDLFAVLQQGFVDELSRTVERNPFLEHDLAGLSEEQALEAGREGAQDALAPFLWNHAVGDLWDVRRVTEFLDMTRHAVYELLKLGYLLGLDGRGTTWFPTWQFDRELRIVRSVTRSIISAFHDAELDPLTIAAWVMSPSSWLEGTSPADWLSEGRDESRVVLAAQRTAAPLSS